MMERRLMNATCTTYGRVLGSAVVGMVGLLVLAGCSHRIAHTTPYYENGPHQVEQPQGMIDEGTPVLVIGRDGSFARVWTPDLLDAYVWDRDLESIWSLKGLGKKEESSAPPVLLEPSPKD